MQRLPQDWYHNGLELRCIGNRIPTTALTGYLVNQILHARTGEKIAVIVNEFGEAGIDGQLVVGAEEEILELNNGCICCTVRGDLTRAIDNLMARRGCRHTGTKMLVQDRIVTADDLAARLGRSNS